MKRFFYSILFFPLVFLILSLLVSGAALWWSEYEFLRFSKEELVRNVNESAYVFKTILEESSLQKDQRRITQMVQRYALQSSIFELHILDRNGTVLYSNNPKHIATRDQHWHHIAEDIRSGRKTHFESDEAIHVVYPLAFIYNPFSHTIQRGFLVIDVSTHPSWLITEKYFWQRLILFALFIFLIALIVLVLIYKLYILQFIHIGKLLLPKEQSMWRFNIAELLNSLVAKINELKLFSAIIQKSHDAVVVSDKELRILSANESFERMTQYSPHESKGKTINALLNPSPPFTNSEQLIKEGQTTRQCTYTKANGERFEAIEERFTIKDEKGQIINIATIIKDITTLLQQQRDIEKLAFYDPLTDLANRPFFLHTLEEFIEIAKREQKRFALLYIDLDDFKEINDTLGHPVGDEVLIEFARRLRGVLRRSDIAARFGGDEFAAAGFIKEPNEALEIGWRIVQQATKPIKIDDETTVSIGASIGVAIYPQNGATSKDLLAAADIALYKAKEHKNRCMLYEEELHQQAIQKMQLKQDLKRAIDKEEFFLLYQPKIDIRANKIMGFEVLIRWQKNDTIVPPFAFIPIAEESGLIVPMTEWILQQLEKNLEILEREGLHTSFAVNISAKHFMAKNLLQMVRQIDKRFLEAGALEIEVTESAVMEDLTSAQNQLKKLKELGVRVALDDYGTGHSSLAYLKHLPIDLIKIDKTFVDNITHSAQDQAIIKSVVALSQSFSIEVLAEGVESEEQLATLRRLGVHAVQGYFYSKPLPFAQMLEYLKNFK